MYKFRYIIIILLFSFCIFSFVDCKRNSNKKDEIARVQFMLDSDHNRIFLDSIISSDVHKMAKKTNKRTDLPQITIY